MMSKTMVPKSNALLIDSKNVKDDTLDNKNISQNINPIHSDMKSS